MRKLLLFAGALLAPGWMGVPASGGEVAKVTYVSTSAIYINAGTSFGINVGDTLVLHSSEQSSDTAALVIVTQVASKSCACRLAPNYSMPKVGYITKFSKVSTADTKPNRHSYTTSGAADNSEKNIFSGELSLAAFGRSDLTESGHSWIQPEIGSRLRIRRLSGTDLVFNFRHRSRFTHRSANSVTTLDNDKWRHRLYVFSVSTENPASMTHWGAGRILPAELNGMGYIDGAFFSRAITPEMRIGVAGGAVPSPTTSEVVLDNKKLGAYVGYTPHDLTNAQLNLSAALSSEFQNGRTSRDFLFLQARYSRGATLSLHNSAEIDWNRGWRYERSNQRLRFTNYFGSLRMTPVSGVSTDLMFDTRKNVVRFVDSEPTDSLIDEEVRKNLRGGIRVSATRNIRLWANGGVRFRESEDNDRFLRLGFNARKFPVRHHSMGASVSIFESLFSTGYRPRIDYRMPAGRSSRLRFSAGGAFYSTGNPDASEVFLEVGAFRRLTRHQSIDMSVRRYFSDIRSSLEVFARISTSLGR